MTDRMIGVIGGSGLYQFEGLQQAEWRQISTPWGAPSDAILTGVLHGTPMAFLPRHGRGHVHSPSSVPYRANIDAMKRLGVTDLVSMSACGSFRAHMAPGDFVIVDQFIDRTQGRDSSFFGTGCVAHVSMAHPTCAGLGAHCATAAQATIAALPALLGSAPRLPCPQGCDHALDTALITAPSARDPQVLARLDAVAGRVL